MPRKSSKPAVLSPAEALATDWEAARLLLGRVRLAGRLFLAGQVLLGWKLASIKKDLGFLGSGRRKESGKLCHFKNGIGENHDSAPKTTWTDYLAAELGIPRRTADHFINVYEAARLKLRRLGHAPALAILDSPPADLDSDQAARLERLVAKITDGQTQRELLEDLHLVKAPPKAPGGHHPAADPAAHDRQLSFDFFAEPVRGLALLRAHKDYRHALYSLPTVGDPDTGAPGLLDIRATLSSMLDDLDEVLAAKDAELRDVTPA